MGIFVVGHNGMLGGVGLEKSIIVPQTGTFAESIAPKLHKRLLGRWPDKNGWFNFNILVVTCNERLWAPRKIVFFDFAGIKITPIPKSPVPTTNHERHPVINFMEIGAFT
jgi:hypothetical protein